MSSASDFCSSDRAQFTTPRIVPMTLVSVAIVAVVINEVVGHVPKSVDPPTVEDVCLGVCGCGACPTWVYGVAIGLGLAGVGLAALFSTSEHTE